MQEKIASLKKENRAIKNEEAKHVRWTEHGS